MDKYCKSTEIEGEKETTMLSVKFLSDQRGCNTGPVRYSTNTSCVEHLLMTKILSVVEEYKIKNIILTQKTSSSFVILQYSAFSTSI
ncbi:hypothetical protein PAMP_007476 [Pampus punctatissimus]